MLYELTLPPAPLSPYLVRDAPCPDRDFLDGLREFISSRLDRVDPYRESAEYCLQQEKASRLHDRLQAMLSEEGRTTLMEYGEAQGRALGAGKIYAQE